MKYLQPHLSDEDIMERATRYGWNSSGMTIDNIIDYIINEKLTEDEDFIFTEDLIVQDLIDDLDGGTAVVFGLEHVFLIHDGVILDPNRGNFEPHREILGFLTINDGILSPINKSFNLLSTVVWRSYLGHDENSNVFKLMKQIEEKLGDYFKVHELLRSGFMGRKTLTKYINKGIIGIA